MRLTAAARCGVGRAMGAAEPQARRTVAADSGRHVRRQERAARARCQRGVGSAPEGRVRRRCTASTASSAARHEPGAAARPRTPKRRCASLLTDDDQARGVRPRARGRLLVRNRRGRPLPDQRLPPARPTSLVCRAIPHRISTIEELALPTVVRELAEEERGIVLLTGTTGSGQVDDAGGDDRPHEQHDEQAHRDDRGPDRVRARRQALGDQPARSRAWTRPPSSGPCAAFCARTRT